MHKLISTLKKKEEKEDDEEEKAKAGNEWSNILPKILESEEKSTTTRSSCRQYLASHTSGAQKD